MFFNELVVLLMMFLEKLLIEKMQQVFMALMLQVQELKRVLEELLEEKQKKLALRVKILSNERI